MRAIIALIVVGLMLGLGGTSGAVQSQAQSTVAFYKAVTPAYQIWLKAGCNPAVGVAEVTALASPHGIEDPNFPSCRTTPL